MEEREVIEVLVKNSKGELKPKFAGSKEAVRNYIGNYVYNKKKQYRCFKEDGLYGFDCGDVVFYTEKDINLRDE